MKVFFSIVWEGFDLIQGKDLVLNGCVLNIPSGVSIDYENGFKYRPNWN